MNGGWRNVWLELYKDSNLVIYKKQGDKTPKGHVVMKVMFEGFSSSFSSSSSYCCCCYYYYYYYCLFHLIF